MLATDFGIDNNVNLCESCHYKLVACTEVQTVFSSTKTPKDSKYEETGELGICMCTGYEPALNIPRVKEYTESQTRNQELNQGRRT